MPAGWLGQISSAHAAANCAANRGHADRPHVHEQMPWKMAATSDLVDFSLQESDTSGLPVRQSPPIDLNDTTVFKGNYKRV